METYNIITRFKIKWAAVILMLASCTSVSWAQSSQKLSKSPIHRYSFDGEGKKLTDSIGGKDGEIYDEPVPVLPYYKGSTTLAIIPDTEGYCLKRPHIFYKMMDWIAKNKDKRNIKGVLHVGDVTNNNLKEEWINARKAFDYIEGKIPYVLAAGNHDYDHTPGRLTYMNEFFKVADQKKWPTFGDVFEEDKLENHYQFLEINSQKWIVLSLEMGPRKKVIEWANKVLDANKDKAAIILTHGYLAYGNERYDHTKGHQRATPYNFYGEGADGQMMWDQMVKKHANVMMVVCGHLSSQWVAYRKDKGEHGNMVHQMLVDYEKMKGGRGFMRLLEFLPDGKTVKVRTYSPVLNEIRSPITKGEKPLRDPSLEEFTFTMKAASGQEKLLAVKEQPAQPSKEVKDDIKKDVLARLNGQGQLVFDKNKTKTYGRLDKSLMEGRKKTSVEVWVTPSSESYSWTPVVMFKGSQRDIFWYTFRTLTKHRAELHDNGRNEDIQPVVKVTPGNKVHVVMTYDETGKDGKPLLSTYLDGRKLGSMVTGIKLSELKFDLGQVGPFAGEFDELRIYDYPLSTEEVLGNYKLGPDKLNLKQ